MTMLDETYDGGGDGYDDYPEDDYQGGAGYDEEETPVSEYGDHSNDADDFESRQLALDGDDY